MSLASMAPELGRAGSVRWLSRRQPILAGPSLGEMGLFLRGWSDDFLGDALRDQYGIQVTGGSSVGLYAMHGGAVRLVAGPTLGDASILWLGSAVANEYQTLQASEGWAAITRFRLSHTTSIRHHMGAANHAGTDRVFFCVDTDIGNNWMIEIQNGARSQYDTGVAIDTAWHVARLQAYSDGAALYLDGAHLGSHDVAMPAGVLKPVISIATLLNANRDIQVDYWKVVPR